MLSASAPFSALRLIIAAALTVLFCAGSAVVIVGWMPGADGPPADVLAILE